MKVLAAIVASLGVSQGFIPAPQKQNSDTFRRYVVAETEAAVSVANAAIPTTIMIAALAAAYVKASEDGDSESTEAIPVFFSKIFSSKASSKKAKTSAKSTKSVKETESTAVPKATDPTPNDTEEKPSLMSKINDIEKPSFLSKFFPASTDSKESVETAEPIAVPEATEPTAEQKPESSTEEAVSPILEELPEPSLEVAPEPAAEVAPEPASEVTPEPAAEIAVPSPPEPVAEVAPEPEVMPEPEPEITPEPAPVIDFSQLKGEIASTLEKENEKMERLQRSVAEEEEAEEQLAVTEEEEDIVEADIAVAEVEEGDSTKARKRGVFRTTFRVVKKVIAPWRKWENIS